MWSPDTSHSRIRQDRESVNAPAGYQGVPVALLPGGLERKGARLGKEEHMRSLKNSASLIAASAILLTAAGASMTTASAAPTERAAKAGAGTSGSSDSPLTAAARAAGKARSTGAP